MTEVLALDGSRLFGQQPKLVPVMKRSHKGRRSRHHVNFTPSTHQMDLRSSPPTATSTMDQTQRSTAGTDASQSEKKKSSDASVKNGVVTVSESSKKASGEKKNENSEVVPVGVLVAERTEVKTGSPFSCAWYCLVFMMCCELLATTTLLWRMLFEEDISIGVHLMVIVLHISSLFVIFFVILRQSKKCSMVMGAVNFLYAFFTAVYILCLEGSKTESEADDAKHLSSIRIMASACIINVCNLVALGVFCVEKFSPKEVTSTTCTCVVVAAKAEPKESKKEKARRILAGTSESIREKSIKKADLVKQKIKEMINKKKNNADADTTSAVKTSASGRRFVSVAAPATPTTEASGTPAATPNMEYLYERV